MSDNGSIDIVQLFDFDKRQLGVILALVEKGPTIVPKMIAQLNASGSMGQAVRASYDEASAEVETVP